MNNARFVKVAGSMLCGLMLVGPVMAESVMIWGSTTCQKRFLDPGNGDLKKATGIDAKILGVGTGKGMVALFKHKADAAAASSELNSAIKSALKEGKKSGKAVTIPDNLVFHEIAKDKIVPIVHKDNPVSSLTWEQLKAINTGKINNWKEVGGPDRAIRVVTSHEGSATRAVFQKMVMKKEDYVSNAIRVRSTRLEIDDVSNATWAIGAVSEAFFAQNPGNTKVVSTEPISRPLGLITIGPASASVQKVIDFYRSGEGKKYL